VRSICTFSSWVRSIWVGGRVGSLVGSGWRVVLVRLAGVGPGGADGPTARAPVVDDATGSGDTESPGSGPVSHRPATATPAVTAITATAATTARRHAV
jgi:hypothetical protein